jgi:hypothetical protein
VARFASQSRAEIAQAKSASANATLPKGRYRPGRIANPYNLFLPGEKEALPASPSVAAFQGDSVTARLGANSKALKVGDAMARDNQV